MRENLLAMLARGENPFPGILGYERTVVPALVNALLARHDVILLGLRGQAKTRILRALVNLLDEEIPVMAGSELNESPFAPFTVRAALAATAGDRRPVAWLEREERYREKLATPDVTIADLIGDVDPVKAATLKKRSPTRRSSTTGSSRARTAASSPSTSSPTSRRASRSAS